MGKFKIGDRVRCINDSDTDVVKRGKEYDVVGVNDPYIDVLEDGEPRGMYAYRFELTPAITIEPGKHYRTRSGKPTGRVTVGDTGFEAVVGGRVRIYDAAGGHVHGDADLDIVEAWVPRVGERVVLVKDGKSTTGAVGKAATVITWSDGSFIAGDEYLLDIDPPVNYKTVAVTPKFTRATIDCFEPLPVAAEAQPAAPLKIEAGKFYRTRDGRKVGPIVVAQGFDDPWPWKATGVITSYYFKHNGYSCPGSAHLHADADDLVAEWQDAPSAPVAAQVDTIAEEYGPVVAASRPKFKVDDRVKAIKGTAVLKVGEIYTVERVDGYRVYVGVDDYGTLNYGQDYFDLVPAQQPEPDTTLHIKFTSDFSVLDAAILVRKKKLKKLIKLARKAGIELREAA